MGVRTTRPATTTVGRDESHPCTARGLCSDRSDVLVADVDGDPWAYPQIWFDARGVSDGSGRFELMFESVVRVRGQLSELVSAVDPDAVSGPTARELWAEFDRIERLGSAGKTLLARRIAATHDRDRAGSRTAAESLAKKAGTSTAAAKEALDTSNRLTELPGVAGALRHGELSPAQAAAITSAAEADPSAESRLVELAGRASLVELREECARVRAAADPDPDATNRRIHAQRRCRQYTDAEGGWNLSARGTAQDGAAFTTVLNAITDQVFTAARRDSRHEPVEAYAFDALMAMAQHASRPDQPAAAANGGAAPVADPPDGSDQQADRAGSQAGDSPPLAAGDPGVFRNTERRPVGPVPPRRWSNPRYLALLRIDAAALSRGRVDGEELCEIAGIGPVPVTVARGLLGEAIVKLVITNGVDVANVTHLGRGPTVAQKIALMWANDTCLAEGCHRRRIEYDHRTPWAQTRHTRLDELDPLCDYHHDLKTRLGWALVPGKGKRPFVPPDDPRHPQHHSVQARPAAPDRGTRPAAPHTRPPALRSRAHRQPPLPTLVPDDP
jgi:Domain of unknown function (DUF222)